MVISRLFAAGCLAIFVAACAPKPEPIAAPMEPITTEPTYTGKYK